MAKIPDSERYSEQETVQRREAALKRMLATPPKPHSEMKLGKPKPKIGLSPKKRGRPAMGKGKPHD